MRATRPGRTSLLGFVAVMGLVACDRADPETLTSVPNAMAAYAAARPHARSADHDQPLPKASWRTLEAITIRSSERNPRGSAAQAARARVSLHFDRVTPFETRELDGDGALTRRLAIELESCGFSQALPSFKTVSAGGVHRIRLRSHPGEPGRVLFDLDRETAYSIFFTPEPFRLLIDFEANAAVRVPRGALRTIVLDPGHGGDDYGARYGGLREARLVLDITKRVARLLSQHIPEAHIMLTRTEDRLVPLEQRADLANRMDADVFVSIHLNAAEEPIEHGGVATFVLDATHDRQALRLAARENGTSVAKVSGLQKILASLHRSEQVEASRRLAEQVQRTTLAHARRHLPTIVDRGVKSATFYVLVGARMPAVLVEASFLTHPDEAAMLKRSHYRESLAHGIAKGILRYAAASTEVQ